MSNQFRETRKIYSDYLQYTKPLSYVEWVSLPEDHKAAALFVQFFDQIELAWYKAKSFFTSEEDGVYTTMQYLMKNVPIIRDNPKRFTPQYIYKVAYNCLYCICHDPVIERIRYETTTSNVVPTDNGEVDLFDTTVSIHSRVEISYERNELWKALDSLGLKGQKVINHLLNNAPLKKYASNSCWAKNESLKDVEVSKEELEDIKLRIVAILAEFPELVRGE